MYAIRSYYVEKLTLWELYSSTVMALIHMLSIYRQEEEVGVPEAQLLTLTLNLAEEALDLLLTTYLKEATLELPDTHLVEYP